MATTEEQDAALRLVLSIGLEENTARTVIKNPKSLRTLVEVIAEAGATQEGCPRSKGNLLNTVATRFPANALVHRPQLVKYVMAEQIKSTAQLEGAFEYLKKLGGVALDTSALEESCGVGVVVTGEQIKAAIAEAIAGSKEKLLEERYHLNTSIMLGQIGRSLKWADGQAMRAEMDSQVEALLGPKTEADLLPREKPKKAPKAAPDAAAVAAAVAAKAEAKAAEPVTPDDVYAFLPKPEDNNIVHTTINFSDSRRSGKHSAVHTRFPPEPNGYLHIGHAKAMFVNFGMAEQYGGQCYLRYDYTNPEAEKLEYIQHIEDIVQWMGWKPWKITYSSEYFQQLYEFAVQLIETGHAYVCHQVGNENFNMFDLIAYRIKFASHPHVGDKWVIYPSYDYTHCLVDALENITHSLCTLEFETRRASYYWLLEVLDTYKPLVWEYARLNITHNVLSKRKLNKLVTSNLVHGWDDPRLYTLSGLPTNPRPPTHRPVTAVAINTFCRDMGISRNTNLIATHRLEHHIRADLDIHSPRMLVVLRPLKVVITNLPDGHVEMVEAKRFPGREEAVYPVPFSKVCFMEETDFREVDEKDYYGLAPGKSVMLRYAYPIKCTGFTRDPLTGRVTELTAEYDADFKGKKPPKGVMNWVACPAPGVLPPPWSDTWLEELNPDSLTVVQGALACPELSAAKAGDKFQFERLGYFCVDPDSTPGKMVVNRTVSLKDSVPKTVAKQ
ncbi:MAG: hypothetical protein WDW38_011226 [Sanguina aurantia]